MQDQALPLFPLQVVLFPRTPLPLHIFEERYKEMIGEVLEARSEFGIVLAKENGIVNVGCTAVVESVLQKYPDGRLDILTTGMRRFEILLLNEERSYLRGSVQFFDDEPAEPVAAEEMRKAVEGYQAYLAAGETGETPEPRWEDPQLSFQLAQPLADLDFRQQLLSMRSEADRLRHLGNFFPGHIARRRRIAHVRQVAPTNGHGHGSVS